MYRRALLLLFFSWMFTVHAQSVPIGQWREHFPYRQGVSLATGGGRVYCATPYSLLAVSVDDHDLTRYSKVNGLHDAGIAAIGFHESTASLVIAYNNSNVDILRQENIINLPDIMLQPVPGDKRIRHIAFHGYYAYLSTGIGIIVIDLQKQEITDTYTLGIVNAVAADGAYLYAATASGVKRGLLQGVNLADISNWEDASTGLRAAPVTTLIQSGGLQCLQADTVYQWQNNQWQRRFGNGNAIRKLTADGSIIQASNILQGSQIFNTPAPNDALQIGNTLWVADAQNGLMQYDGTWHNFSPNSPNGIVTGEMAIIKDALWAASGSVTDNWLATGNKSGLYRFEQDEWTNYTYPDSLADILTVAAAGDAVYAGSFGGGLISIGGAVRNNIFISGMATDRNDNLWISDFGAINNLLVKKKDNSWQSFSIPIFHLSNAVSQILIDDADQKWIVSPRGNGLFTFNHGADIAQTTDDQWKLYKSGAGQGNLPSNNVYCAAKDLRGWIWIGTARGVAVVQCPLQRCDAIWPVVKQDDFAGYLFQNEQVNTIAVDGANQKWVGTQNGVWLVSPDGDKILQHFNTDNSPLSNNIVHHIIVHPETGEVFIATASGLISWRGTATEGKQHQDDKVLVFPNPVPSGYEGTIAIRGLIQNAIVKITDVTGKLVFQTRAQGGQAVWSGRDYKGHRPQSGVYLVFSTDETGQEKIVSKLVFIH